MSTANAYPCDSPGLVERAVAAILAEDLDMAIDRAVIKN
jgi:hypothetical protein